MDNKELIIFNSYQWDEGIFFNSYLNNDYLYNKEKTDFNIQTDVINIQSEFANATVNDSGFVAHIEKETNDSISSESFLDMNTKFYNEDNIEIESKYLKFSFDWEAIQTPDKDYAEMTINISDNSYLKITLYNRKEIKIEGYDNTSLTVINKLESDIESLGDINNLISNNINNLDVEVVTYEDNADGYVDIRFSGSGYKSKWITFNTATTYTSIRNIDFNFPVVSDYSNKKLSVSDIQIEGYSTGVIYESKIYDSKEKGSLLKSLSVHAGIDNKIEQLFTDANLRVKVLTSDNEDLSTFTETEYNFIYNTDDYTATELIDNMSGRYFKVIISSMSLATKIFVNYIKLDYQLQSSIMEKVYNLEEKTVTQYIPSHGGVIDFKDSMFNIKFYIPPDALTAETNISITRLSEDDDRIAHGSIGFKFEPSGLQFNKPCLMEIDYAGLKLNNYQNEKGIELIYIKNENPSIEDYDNVDSLKDTNNKKIIGYINHFSLYCLQATSNEYSNRTRLESNTMPSWMKLQSKDSNFQKFLNYSLLQEVDQVIINNSKANRQRYIDVADLSQTSTSFKHNFDNFLNNNNAPISNIGIDSYAFYKGKKIKVVFTELEFFLSRENVFYVDKENQIIHFQEPFDDVKLIVNDIVFQQQEKLIEQRIWNAFDEFALLMDLERLPQESNQSLKNRVLDVRKNPPSSNEQGLLNAISRELDIDQDSISIWSLNQDKYQTKFYTQENISSTILDNLAHQINDELNLFWDQAKWGEAFWDTVDTNLYEFLHKRVV